MRTIRLNSNSSTESSKSDSKKRLKSEPDDEEDDDTFKTGLIESKMLEIQKEVFYPIIHVWHEDNGFQKTIILNKAILETSTEYILMTDGDCIPREDFVEHHVKYREEGYFLSGGYYKLPMNLSKQITSNESNTSG